MAACSSIKKSVLPSTATASSAAPNASGLDAEGLELVGAIVAEFMDEPMYVEP
jgi:hypothetical protein